MVESIYRQVATTVFTPSGCHHTDRFSTHSCSVGRVANVPSLLSVRGCRVADDDWALCVGIGDYAVGKVLPPLPGARADAARFYQWVTSPEGGAERVSAFETGGV